MKRTPNDLIERLTRQTFCGTFSSSAIAYNDASGSDADMFFLLIFYPRASWLASFACSIFATFQNLSSRGLLASLF